jgi:hypothetical protein
MIKYIFLLLILSACTSISTNLYIDNTQQIMMAEYSYNF